MRCIIYLKNVTFVLVKKYWCTNTGKFGRGSRKISKYTWNMMTLFGDMEFWFKYLMLQKIKSITNQHQRVIFMVKRCTVSAIQTVYIGVCSSVYLQLKTYDFDVGNGLIYSAALSHNFIRSPIISSMFFA